MTAFFTHDPAQDEAWVATALHRMGNVIDLISGDHAILPAFAKASAFVPIAGGHTMTQPLLIQESGTTTWFKGMDKVSKDFTPGLTSAEYSMSYVSAPVRQELTTSLENMGSPAVMSSDDIRFKQARITMRNALRTAAVSGTGGREPKGLLSSIEALDVGSQVEVVGGINKALATNQWWNNQHRQLGAGVKFGTDANGIPSGILLMMQLYLDCVQGNSVPRWCYTSPGIGENVLRAIMIQYGIRSSGKIDESVEPTPHNVSLFGRPIIPTAEIPVDTFLWLTLNKDAGMTMQNRTEVGPELSPKDLGGMYFAHHPQLAMTLDGPRVASDRHASWSFFLSSLALLFENMAQQGRGSSADVSGLEDWS